jgi:peptidoglycan DL-endopeptidase CwlO
MARPHHPARTPLRPSRTLLAAAIAGGIALTPLPATADPETPLTSSEAAARLADKGRELEVVSEQVNEAREQLASQKDAAEAAAADVADALAALDDARQQVRTVARGAYTGSSLTTFEVMLASKDPEDLLDRVGMLTTVARYNGGVLDDATAAGAQAREARATAEAAADEATALVRRVTAQQAVLDRQVDTYKADYERLLAEEEAAREAAEQAAREAAERASRATRAAPAPASEPTPAQAPAQAPAQRADTSTAAAPPAPAAAGGSAAARTAVSTALAQVGDSYVWGAAGPNSFDCSGLTQYAYAAAGISLPHSSRMQATMGSPVSVSALQPGDLLFYYSPVSHVSMYVGNGQMVHASTYGQPVKVVGIGDMPSFSHAVRIV